MMMVQDQIAKYVEEQARWRDLKAEEYPEDARNGRCAVALRELGAFIRSLPPADERLAMLDMAHDDVGTGMFLPGEQCSALISQYGFHNPRKDPGEFLRAVVELYDQERTREIENDQEQLDE